MVEARTNKDGGRMLFRFSNYNNGVRSARAYNNDNTLASITFSGAPIGSYSYSWDANKNKTAETITGAMSGYSFTTGNTGHDDEDRLTGFTRGTLSQSWNLTSVGDWASFTSSGVGFQPAIGPRTHGPAHELTSVGGSPVTHDTKGNVTSKPSFLNPTDTSSLAWDFDNRLDAIDVDGDTSLDVTFDYDALGRRVRKNDIVYALSGQQVVAEYAAGTAATSPTEKYVYASYIDEPVLKDGTGGLQYYHRNQQHSIIALTGSIGAISERYAYDAYGSLEILDSSGKLLVGSSTSGNSFTYTGRRFDLETGDFYYRARYYDSSLGRFLSRDPIGYVSGFNLSAAYFGLSQTDPGGLHPAVIVVGGVVITYEAAAAIAAAYSLTVAACLMDDECSRALQQGAREAVDGIDDAIASVREWVEGVVRWLKDCRLKCNMKVDGPNHAWYYPTTKYPFVKKCWQSHVQANCWLNNVPGSKFSHRVPFGPCCKLKHCAGGTIH